MFFEILLMLFLWGLLFFKMLWVLQVAQQKDQSDNEASMAAWEIHENMSGKFYFISELGCQRFLILGSNIFLFVGLVYCGSIICC
jgi:hypothetical protein